MDSRSSQSDFSMHTKTSLELRPLHNKAIKGCNTLALEKSKWGDESSQVNERVMYLLYVEKVGYVLLFKMEISA